MSLSGEKRGEGGAGGAAANADDIVLGSREERFHGLDRVIELGGLPRSSGEEHH